MGKNNIADIDENFALQSDLTREDVKIYDVCEEPFHVYGLLKPKDKDDYFRRIPLEIANKVSEGVVCLHTNTAGGRVRFATNSSYVAIHAELDNVPVANHMPLTVLAGFDLYRKTNDTQEFVHCFIPPCDIVTDKVYESEIYLAKSDMAEYTLNFPLYGDVKKLYIILEESALVCHASQYKNEKPVVFYGSSITQGGCASRPGNSYEDIISRRLDMDYINLGFSGNAKGELPMAEYIAKIPMSVFVYDYDYNAPNIEHLRNTYALFFNKIRETNPNIPVICISKPYRKTDEDLERRKFIRENVEKWRSEGDTNVYFIDGHSFSERFQVEDSMTIDGVHPNDLGFWCMANIIGEKLQDLLNTKK